MPLDSDTANADAHLHVEFYEHDRDPYKGVPFVRIIIPGDKTFNIDQPAQEHHKERFPRQWLYFQMKQGESQIIGTPLSEWNRERPDQLTDGQLAELTILKFQSVEQLAGASDIQISRLGMGGTGLRQRAREYINGKNSKIAGAEFQNLRDEIAQLKAQLASGPIAPEQPKKRRGAPKGGWPKKVKQNVEHNDAAANAAGVG